MRGKHAHQTEALTEFVDSRGITTTVEPGLIKGVKILGLESRNGRSYKAGALAAAVGLYEGAKVNVNHPKGAASSPRDYQDRLGSLKNVRATESGLFGDLSYNPEHSLGKQLAWDAQHAPENVGLSHNVEAVTSKGPGGRVVVESITKVTSVDLVADPATTRSLYEHDEGTDMKEITLEQLKAERPDLLKKILTEQEEGEQAKAKEAELAKLKEQVKEYQAEKAKTARKAVIDKALTEAKLPDVLLTELFREDCYAADDARLAALIADRMALAKRVPSGGTSSSGKPKSKGPEPDAVTESIDPKAYAKGLFTYAN